MKIFGLGKFLRYRARARLRRVMRGYRLLRKAGNLRRIAAVKEALTATPVFEPQKAVDIFAGLGGKAAEIAVRQFLLARLVSTGLGAALLNSVGSHNRPVVYPLPSAWRKTLIAHDFVVAERVSAILWACVVALYAGGGIFVMLKLALADIRGILHVASRATKRHVYFDALGPGNLPLLSGEGKKNDIVSWYCRWPGRALELDSICHNVMTAGVRQFDGVAVLPVSSPLTPLAGWASVTRFLIDGFVAIYKAFWSLAARRWWSSVMLGETVKAIHVRVQDPSLLARDYLFHNSNWIYRPLWTYQAERAGARILFYFYSTNIEQFKQSGVYPGMPYGWQTMTWPRYLVWDSYQAAFVRRAVGSTAHIETVGTISFNSGANLPQDLPNHAIAVFDVQPMRDAVYQPLGIELEYYIPRNANSFLMDIQVAAASAERVILFKRKRDVGTRVHPCYECTTSWLSGAGNCLEVDTDISATALIEKCQAVISMPFTSTALIGREQGKPSVYYDPHGICEKDDRAAHGIPILSGKSELKEWLSSLPA